MTKFRLLVLVDVDEKFTEWAMRHSGELLTGQRRPLC